MLCALLAVVVFLIVLVFLVLCSDDCSFCFVVVVEFGGCANSSCCQNLKSLTVAKILCPWPNSQSHKKCVVPCVSDHSIHLMLVLKGLES